MLWAGTFAPHLPADHAKSDADLYRHTPLPKPPSFNEADVLDKPEWVRDTPRLRPGQIETLKVQHRDRLRSLRDVDEMVGDILRLLENRGELELARGGIARARLDAGIAGDSQSLLADGLREARLHGV